MNPRHEELIHRLIDGELSESERSELEACLSSSPAARAFHERMLLLQRAGEGRIDIAPPPQLKSEVMRRIRSGSRQPTLVSGSWRESLSVIWAAFTPRVAYGLAAGVILGFAIGAMSFTAGTGEPPSSRSLEFSGTLGLPSPSERVSQIDSDHYESAGVSLNWSASRSADLVIVKIRIHATTGAALTLIHDPESVVCQAIRRDNENLAEVKIEAGSVVISDAHDGEYAALLRIDDQAPQQIDLNVVVGGETYRHTIAIQN